MPLNLEDTFYLEAPLKVYLDHDTVQSIVTSDKSLAGTGRAIFSSVTLPTAGDWKIVGYGRFSHPVAGKYLYTWIDKEVTWASSTDWDSFLDDSSLSKTLQAVKIENTGDYVDIHVESIVTTTSSTTFNWSFTTDDASTGVFFDATSGASINPLISAINLGGKVENQAYFFAFKMSS
ncbi:hypothetical protein N9064_00235 [bacterium]|nr:hypothetical protein [bacterium]